MAWWSKHWEDLRPQIKFEVLKWLLHWLAGSALLSGVVSIYLWARKSITDWHGFVVVSLLSLIVLALLNWPKRKAAQRPAMAPGPAAIIPQPNQATAGIIPGIPTLSSLLGQNPSVNFDAKQFFAQAHYSPITAETENNIKLVAAQSSPSDKEAFYARFIGIGLVAYFHDETWYTIYGSQLQALSELNSKGIVALSTVKAHYDTAAIKFTALYPKYTFNEWLHYMEARMLIVKYPSNMIDITHFGKDFLKYLTHAGRNIGIKAF